jgi:hypothetical protein
MKKGIRAIIREWLLPNGAAEDHERSRRVVESEKKADQAVKGVKQSSARAIGTARRDAESSKRVGQQVEESLAGIAAANEIMEIRRREEQGEQHRAKASR